MIRIVLLGRTGNILFQYALGRALAGKHGVPLVLDASWYNSTGWREISHLLKLPLKAKVERRFSLAARALRNLGGGKHPWEWRQAPFLRERTDDQSFDPAFLDAPPDCTLFGYFQSPAYFQNIEDGLREELRSLFGIGRETNETRSTEASLAEASSVALHVRRSDYLVHPAFQVCGSDYYRNAISCMRALVPDARFFIFSDDPEWCRANFRDSDTSVIDSGKHAMNPLHDLRMMSLAAHHIIANSTYSWWAAWLAKRNGQQVMMPDRWYANDLKAPIIEKQCAGWTLIRTEP